MTVYYRAPELPWNDGGQQQRFFGILAGLLLLVAVVGIAIPMIELPAKDRKELEQLPPQLAKVLERKKKEKPKPKPVPVEKKEEKKSRSQSQNLSLSQSRKKKSRSLNLSPSRSQRKSRR